MVETRRIFQSVTATTLSTMDLSAPTTEIKNTKMTNSTLVVVFSTLLFDPMLSRLRECRFDLTLTIKRFGMSMNGKATENVSVKRDKSRRFSYQAITTQRTMFRSL